MAEQLTQANAPNWLQWVTDFDRALSIWNDSIVALKSRLPWIEKNAPHLLAEHKRVIRKFQEQAPKINDFIALRNTIINGVNNVIGGAKTVADFTGITAAIDWAKSIVGLGGYVRDESGLGVAPVIWIGASIATAVALVIAMAGVANDGFKQVTRVDAYKLALEKGATPQQAADAVNAALGMPKDNNEQFLGLPIREAMLAAVLIVLGPPIIKAVTDGRK